MGKFTRRGKGPTLPGREGDITHARWIRLRGRQAKRWHLRADKHFTRCRERYPFGWVDQQDELGEGDIPCAECLRSEARETGGEQ